MSSLASLTAASDDRKARLAKLKTLKRKQPADEVVAPESDREASVPAPGLSTDADHDNEDGEGPRGGRQTQDEDMQDTAKEEEREEETTNLALRHISGRNYDPEARGAKLGFEAPPTLNMEGPTLEEQAAEMERDLRARAAEEAKEADKGIDLFKLQPKKPNWDLKRDLDKKLEILNVRTDNAIAKLVREKIMAKSGSGQAGSASDSAVMEDGADVDGVALVEGMRLREREEAAEERRERLQDEDDLA